MVENEREDREQQGAKAELYHEREPDPVGLRPDSGRAPSKHGDYRAESDERDRDLSERKENVACFADDSLLRLWDRRLTGRSAAGLAANGRPKHPFRCQTLPKVNWSVACPVSCSAFHEKANRVNLTNHVSSVSLWRHPLRTVDRSTRLPSALVVISTEIGALWCPWTSGAASLLSTSSSKGPAL